MTNPSKDNAPKDLPPPTVNKPLVEARFTKFYLTMLVLSTVGTTLSTLSLFSIPQSIKNFGSEPFYTTLELATYVVTLLSIVALVLLWKKDINGLYLKLGTYMASFLLGIGLILTAGDTIDKAVKSAIEEISKQGTSVDKGLLTDITTISIYAGFTLGLISAITFGLLWWFAWKNQAKADSDS